MKKSFIRKVAIHLAFFELFSSSALATDVVLIDDSNKDNPIYERYDEENNKYYPISIFDTKNARYEQYGANQGCFEEIYFYRLLENPLVMEEIQKVFPWQGFTDKEEALIFYKYYLSNISKSGCGYAAVTNFIFRLFEGREDEFYQTFGYPMYDVNKLYVDFNYELFILKYFNYYMKSTDNTETVRNLALYDAWEYLLNDYKEKKKNYRKSFSDLKKMTYDEYHEWSQLNNLYNDKISYYQECLKKVPAKNRGYSLWIETSFGNMEEYLKQFGINVKIEVLDGFSEPNVDDIVAGENYNLYDTGNNITGSYDHYGVNPHYVYITDKKENKIIVSSWGKMFEFDNRDAKWTSMIKIKVLKN